ncbi:MAG: hypothetical protein HY568_05030 [Candidatus Latescibacteria bacterium]|nr:hypothetical protein [Candidatus Latescibacterota bacterium]
MTAAWAPPGFAQPAAVERDEPRVTSTFGRTGEERDRVEAGAGVVAGYFDVVGSLGYRRFIGERGPFERSLQAELTGASKAHLTEGIASLYLFFRPERSYRQAWRIRPLLEGGPGLHLVVQAASIEGFRRTNYKAHAYIKSHAYGGVEILVTNRLGVLVRGRFSVPSDHPFDYAQAAIFLR